MIVHQGVEITQASLDSARDWVGENKAELDGEAFDQAVLEAAWEIELVSALESVSFGPCACVDCPARPKRDAHGDNALCPDCQSAGCDSNPNHTCHQDPS